MTIENGSRQVSVRIEVGLKEKAHAAGISKRGKKKKRKKEDYHEVEREKGRKHSESIREQKKKLTRAFRKGGART